MNNFREIFDRLKLLFQVKTDKAVAEKLNINYNTIKTWSNRGKVPIETLLNSIQSETYNINWLLTGRGSMYLDDKNTDSTNNSGIQILSNSNNNINGNISIFINKEDFKDDSEDIKKLISLLKYAPKSLIHQIIERLEKFKELSQI